MSAEPQVFVIMPFSLRDTDRLRYGDNDQHWSEVYEAIVQPACRECGCTTIRDDEDMSSRMIFDQIVERLEESELVLCDLSSSNPNVYFELGWAFRAAKRVVMLKDDVTDRAFDVQGLFTVNYSHHLRPRDVTGAVSRLANSINQTLASDRPSILETSIATRKVSLAAAGGDHASTLLSEVLSEVRAISRWARWPLQTGGQRVRIFVHAQGFTEGDGLALVKDLHRNGVEALLTAHVDPEAPDSIFIATQCQRRTAQHILRSLPYRPQFIFDPNYPDAECGALSEYVVSVGLSSRHRAAAGVVQDRPFIIPAGWLESVSACTSDTEFSQLLAGVPFLTRSSPD